MHMRARWKKRQRQAERRADRHTKNKAGGEKKWELPESSKASTMLYRYRGAALAVDVVRKQPMGKQANVFCRMDKGVWQQGTAKDTMRVRGHHLQAWMREQERTKYSQGKEDEKDHVIRAIHRCIISRKIPRLRMLIDRAISYRCVCV